MSLTASDYLSETEAEGGMKSLSRGLYCCNLLMALTYSSSRESQAVNLSCKQWEPDRFSTWCGKPECTTELRAISHRSVAVIFHT